MFIGRTKELNALEKLYKSDKFEFAVIYGRRRVGKTALINQFIADKKSIYFMGTAVPSMISVCEDWEITASVPK